MSAIAAFLLGLTLSIVLQPPARAANGCAITVPDDFSAIQDAINNAISGDKICVKPGTYMEDLLITTDDLELAGSGRKETTIEGVATANAASFPAAVPNIDIKANGFSLHGFTIKSPTLTATDQYTSGVVLTGTNIKIYKNDFAVSGGTPGSQAIQTWNTAALDIGPSDVSGLEISKNNFFSMDAAEVGFGYEGIFINPQDDPADPDNPVVIEKNAFSGELYRAIGSDRPHTEIEKNTMSTDLEPTDTLDFGVVPWGIKVFGGEDVSVEKNRVRDHGAGVFNIGIRLEETVSESSVEKNKVETPAEVGIAVAGDANDVEKNTIHSSGNVGILISGDENEAEKNKVKKSAGFDLQNAGSDNTFEKNKCDTSDPAGLCT